MQLKHSCVNRGGLTSRHWYGRTQHISADSNGVGGVNFAFTLPSKGGGNTRVQLVVAESDLQALLRELARATPRTAKLFARCTQAAVSALIASADKGENAA